MRSIFFAKFDDVAGPIVVCEATSDENELLSPELFDRVHEFIITKKELCGSVLLATDEISQLKVMSSPRSVENEKLYARNEFFFAFGFIFDINTECGSMETVLRKLANVMEALEIESQYLSNESLNSKLKSVLDQVLEGLLFWGECIVPVDEANTIALKVNSRFVDPPQVFEYQVPILVRRLDNLITKDWDLAIQQVVKFVDGQRHIQLISEESSMSVALVKRCIRQLIYYRCVKMVDIFQYSNIYTCTRRFYELYENESMQQLCVSFVAKRYSDDLPSISKILQIFSKFASVAPVSDVLMLYDTDSLNIDERLLVTFGVVNGLIRRIQKYPVYLPSVPKEELQGEDAWEKYLKSFEGINASRGDDITLNATQFDEPLGLEQTSSAAKVKSMVNSKNNMDAICAALWRSADEVELSLEYDDNICVIYK